jgi:hypothetical protein
LQSGGNGGFGGGGGGGGGDGFSHELLGDSFEMMRQKYAQLESK